MTRAKIDWFEIWFTDKKAMIECMVGNMTADLNAGYDYFGKSIREQREMIEKYKSEFDEQMKEFRTMEEGKIQHWCYYDLLRRGVITR